MAYIYGLVESRPNDPEVQSDSEESRPKDPEV